MLNLITIIIILVEEVNLHYITKKVRMWRNSIVQRAGNRTLSQSHTLINSLYN